MTALSFDINVTRGPLEFQALTGFFTDLAHAGVRHAVLRNHEQLPHSLGARDIDIVVRPEDMDKALQVIVQLASQLDLAFANHYRDERLVQFTLFRRMRSGGNFDLKIDFFTSSQVYGIELLSAREMLQDLRWHNGIPVVSEAVQLLDKLLFHLVVGKPLHAKYDSRFGQIAKDQRPRLLEALIPITGRSEAEQLVHELASCRGSLVAPAAKPARLRMLSRMWGKQRGVGLPLMVRFLSERMRNQLRPHGVFVSVSGPDGAGKTTVIDLVLAQLRQIYGPDAVEYHHFRPASLPRIAEVAKSAKALGKVDEDYSKPHRAAPSGSTGSLARLGYYAADYLWGYFRAIRPSLVERKVVLFDRYYYDMIADPGRSRIRLPVALLRAVGKVLPLPSFAFFIRVAPEMVHRRKQELTLERIRELNDRYDDLARRRMLIAISNDGAPEQAADAIIGCIIQRQDVAARRKLGLTPERHSRL